MKTEWRTLPWLVATGLFLPGRAAAESIDQRVEAAIRPIANTLAELVFYKIDLFGQPFPLIVLWLAVAALFFTFYLGFVNIRGFVFALRHIRGQYNNPAAKGEISHFQAVATAVSGTVGIGNIGGVAVAIVIGGPGAAFWLFIAGFLSMSTKLVECTLGVKYRRHNLDGSVSGGPMYYLEHYLSVRGMPRPRQMFGWVLRVVIGHRLPRYWQYVPVQPGLRAVRDDFGRGGQLFRGQGLVVRCGVSLGCRTGDYWRHTLHRQGCVTYCAFYGSALCTVRTGHHRYECGAYSRLDCADSR